MPSVEKKKKTKKRFKVASDSDGGSASDSLAALRRKDKVAQGFRRNDTISDRRFNEELDSDGGSMSDSSQRRNNKVARDFRRNVTVSDQRYLLKSYKGVFLGADAVTFLIERGYAKSREDALRLGRSLEEKELFEHVTGEQDFQDANHFYRFCDARSEQVSNQYSDLTISCRTNELELELEIEIEPELEREREREQRQKERDERRNHKLQDAKDAKLGCCFDFAEFLAKVVHLFDGIIGVCCLVYGAFMNMHENPATEAAIISLVYGSFLLSTSIAGVVGFSLAAFRRCGLVLSMCAGAVLSLFYVFGLTYILANQDPIFDYITEHKDGMGLNVKDIATLRSLLPLFAIFLTALVITNIVRFTMLLYLRENLLHDDAAKKRIGPEESSSTTPLLDQERGSVRYRFACKSCEFVRRITI